MSSDDFQVALSNCDKEPVHIPGRIQPFGCMLAFDLNSGLVTHHSANLSELFGITGRSPLGTSYEDAINSRPIVHGIRGALSLPTIHRQRDRIGVFPINERSADVSVYATDSHCVVEFEGIPRQSAKPQSPVSVVRSMMSAVRDGDGVMSLLETSVRALRHVTGHDRVMAYKFLENDDGEVIAEAKGPGIEPCLGLRYPAWDIPTQVRQIMLRAPFRVIEDIHAEHSALVQLPAAIPLDMTLSHLRGVSPIHIEYLGNMGVRATMNTSIVVRGRLWGLFAFHHYRPRKLTPDERSIAELFGQLVSMMVQKEEEQAKIDRARRTQSTLTSLGSLEDGVEAAVARTSSALLETVQADGLVLQNGDAIHSYGDTPADPIVSLLCQRVENDVSSLDSLIAVPDLVSADATTQLGKSAGALIVRLHETCWLTFFRNEVIHFIRWAGGKEKQITVGANGPRLTPRGSFAEYRESVAGRCNPWTEEDHVAASEVCRSLWKTLQLDSQARSEELQRQKQYQDLLIAELNHRVRNTLALVRSIARQTQTASDSLGQYVEMLENRIAALSSAHELIGGSGLQWARIGDLIKAELKPFTQQDGRVSVEGPPLAVRADVAPILALLFHEMVSNAVKHGALSENGKDLQVDWKEDAGGLLIQWKETLKQTVPEPQRRGFGFALIERALPYECNGWSKINIAGESLEVQFWLPEEKVDRLAALDQRPAADKEEPTSIAWNDDIRSALVVEDNLVLAMEVERLLLDMGIASVDTVPSVETAESAIANASFDCAILDINLGAETSFSIASKLLAAGTRVVFASGYDSKFELPGELAHVPRIVKPIGRVDVTDALLKSKRVQSP